jgi:hypothetical protein
MFDENFRKPNKNWFINITERIKDLFRRRIPTGNVLKITSFDPQQARPGDRLTIKGQKFASTREGNLVEIGGAQALVLKAEPDTLEVIANLETKDGPVKVEVGGNSAIGPYDFEVLKPPQSKEDGPPVFFEGAGQVFEQGAPSKGTLDVLVVLCQANDLAAPNPANIRNDIVSTFGQVTTFYDQASYHALDVNVDVTNNWRTLDGTINDMMAGDNLDVNRLNQIIAEAAQQAVDEGFDLDDYTLIAAMVYTNQGIRAWGGGSYTNFQYVNASSGININISTSHALSAIWINETADWGRCAHEVGHCILNLPGNLSAWQDAAILKEDVYRSDLVDPNAATAAEFDMMGSHDNHPLFSAYYMEQMGYYSPSNIREIQWDRNPYDQNYELVAHGDTENSLGNRYHVLRIKVTEGLYYYVEVRQRPDSTDATPNIFDENIPIGASTHEGGVIVTKVFTDTVNMNQQMRFITLLHDSKVLVQGESASDPARYLTISVANDHLVERPLTCRVNVAWAQVIGDTPGGDFDLRIDPWNASYETPDIWIDRAPYGSYDYTDPSTGEPTGNGDKPKVLAQNKFYARVHCDGAQDANNVKLTFYTVTPPGVGDNGNWAPLNMKTISVISHGTSGEANVIWVPQVGEHTCLKVYAEPQAGEIYAGSNNSAQENIFNFEAASSSVPDPLIIPIAVRNPLKRRSLALISIRNVPQGYVIQFPHQWVWLDALEERKFELVVFPVWDYFKYTEFKTFQADIVVDGWIPRSYEEIWESGLSPASTFMPMGGILSQVTPKRRVEVALEEDKEKSGKEWISLRGWIKPAMANEILSVELTDPKGGLRVKNVKTNASGEFYVTFYLLREHLIDEEEYRVRREPIPGEYIAQAFVINSPHAAQAESNRLKIYH